MAYLAAIEPDCTFYITNYETRKQSRESEKAALEVGIEKLEASPVFKNAVAAQEREDLGKCITLCDKFGSDHAECLACQEDVRAVALRCPGRPGTGGVVARENERQRT